MGWLKYLLLFSQHIILEFLENKKEKIYSTGNKFFRIINMIVGVDFVLLTNIPT